MSEFSLEALLDSRRGEDLDLWAKTINPQFVRVLRTIGFDRTWARAEGAYLYDADGTRFLDLLGGAPVRSHLVSELVALDREYTAEPREERWEDWYSRQLLERFDTA